MPRLLGRHLKEIMDEIDTLIIGLDEMCGIGGPVFPDPSAVNVFETCLGCVVSGNHPDEYFAWLIDRVTSIVYPDTAVLTDDQRREILDIIQGCWILYQVAQEVA